MQPCDAGADVAKCRVPNNSRQIAVLLASMPSRKFWGDFRHAFQPGEFGPRRQL